MTPKYWDISCHIYADQCIAGMTCKLVAQPSKESPTFPYGLWFITKFRLSMLPIDAPFEHHVAVAKVDPTPEQIAEMKIGMATLEEHLTIEEARWEHEKTHNLPTTETGPNNPPPNWIN